MYKMKETTEQNIIATVGKRRKGFNRKTLENAITLAVEIAREGREGRKIGTMFWRWLLVKNFCVDAVSANALMN